MITLSIFSVTVTKISITYISIAVSRLLYDITTLFLVTFSRKYYQHWRETWSDLSLWFMRSEIYGSMSVAIFHFYFLMSTLP